MTTPRLAGRSAWVVAAAAAATIAGLVGIVVGSAALSSSATTGGGVVVPVVGMLAVLVGFAAFVLAVATWLGRGWARPLGLVVAPAFGAIAVIDGLFVAGGLLGPVAIVGVGLAATILVSLARSDVRPTDDRSADEREAGS